MAEFKIDPRLVASSEPLAALKLSEARLQTDARWTWIVLIPRRPGARELEHLTPADRALLLEEIVAAGSAVRAMGAALGRSVEKLNVGALGNRVEQLHVHVVGRRCDDPAWPDPVWGMEGAVAYAPASLAIAQAAALPAFEGMKRKPGG
ncbi:MAG TPA: HIT domain-containing protein [Caulobacteraceae bacterium]|jgi:diadenosine tetraphosphate (Ap4A) HIT family hydrolase|nr:HIT domain-containing protein [Caulobacteraceae bacterium]